MKSFFLYCLALLFLFSCTRMKKRSEKNSLAQYHLKGKVRLLTQFDYSLSHDTSRVLRDSLIQYFNWKFDKKGNSIEWKSKRSNAMDTNSSVAIYDSNEHLVKDSGGLNVEIYQYDEKGNMIRRVQYYYPFPFSNSIKPKIGITDIYKIDKNGNEIEDDCFWGNKDSLNYKACIEYNISGQELKRTCFDNEGKSFSKVIRIYNTKGNQTEYQFYTHDTLERKTKNKFDTNGNEIESCTYKKDGELENKYSWDDKGNLVEFDYTEANGSVARYSYHYENFDKEGNWLRSITFLNGKPTLIERRTIEYYQ